MTTVSPTRDAIGRLVAARSVKELAQALARVRAASASGVWGSSVAAVVAGVERELRRLRQLLRPGGLVVLNAPNLDSAHADLFGPTWAQWQVPYHRFLTGRRGLKRTATLADFRLVRFNTLTLPYPACVSVQLNDLGLGAVVPDTARFPNDVASRGVRLTGWSRLWWDWRGKGDFLFAVLRAM